MGYDSASNCLKDTELKNYKVKKRSYCEERWYDWYTTPNYHLGNNFTNVLYNGEGSNIVRCYQPCENDQVPLYRIDPVDKEKMGDEKNQLDKCVSKTQYFSEKYNGSDNFCPLAVVNLTTMSPQRAQAVLTDIYNTVRSSNTVTQEFTDFTTPRRIQTYASNISMISAANIPDQITEGDEYANRACSTLETPERVATAYQLCKNLSANEDRAGTMFGHLADPTTAAKLFKQSCNSLFCNQTSSALNLSKQDPICFGNIENTKR
jgi:hypothetical protein